MKAKKVADRGAPAERRAGRARPGAAAAAAAAARATSQVLGEGADAAPAVVDLLRAGGAGPMILVLVEIDARRRGHRGVPGDAHVRPVAVRRPAAACPIDAVVVGDVSDATLRRRARGLRRPRRARADRRRRSTRSPAPPGPPGIERCSRATGSVVVMAAGTPARQRGAGARGRPAGVAMAANVLVLRRAVAVHGDPPGRRRHGAGGDAAVHAAGGLHRRRPRGRGRARPTTPVPASWSSRRPRSPRPTWSPASSRPSEPEPDLSGCAEVGARSSSAPVAAPAAPTGSATCSSSPSCSARSLGVSRVVTSPGLAAAPRAGRPDRQPDLARPLHPVRHQRRHPALGGLLQREDDPGDQHRPRRARWSPRRRTP